MKKEANVMISQNDCDAIALKRFSLINSVLNGQVTNRKKYFEELCANPIDMPHYGLKHYAPKTLYSWLNMYLKGKRKITPYIEKSPSPCIGRRFV